MDIQTYDAVLVIQQENICEDNRTQGVRASVGQDSYVGGSNNYYDPAVYQAWSFGNSLRQSLNNIGNGYTAEVTDFKKWVIVRVTYSNVITGRSAAKTFLVVFQDKSNGMVFNTHNKYRTISGVDQAATYIRSSVSGLKGDTNQTL